MNQMPEFKKLMWFYEVNDDKWLTVRGLVKMMSKFISDSEETVDSEI